MSMDKLIESLVPDLDYEESKWAQRWVQGPLGASLASHAVSDAVSATRVVTASATPAEVQSWVSRLSKKKTDYGQILRLFWLLKNRQADDSLVSTPVVSAMLLDATLAEPTLTRAAIDGSDNKNVAERTRNVEIFSFGQVATETDIVQDLVYVLQGIDGKWIRLKGHSDVWISPQLELAGHVEGAVRVLAEMGSLYVAIVHRLAATPPATPLSYAFKTSISNLLAEYVSIAALVDGNVAQWTLIKLLAWLAIPIRKLRHVRQLVDSVCTGGDTFILTEIHTYTQRRIFRSVFVVIEEKVVSAWLSMVAVWVTKGRLLKENEGDFFVHQVIPPVQHPRLLSREDNRADSAAVWRDTYRINRSLIPPWVSNEVVESVLLTGKSLAFIRLCCEEQDWFDLIALPSGDDNGETPIFVSRTSMREDVSRVGAKYNQRVVELIMEKYRLVDHCLSIRRFLLLSQGDFADALMDAAGRELLKPGSEQNKYELGFLIDTAVRQSPTSDLNSDRLDVFLSIPTGVTDTGYDVFSLSYVVTSPTDAVLTPDAITEYRKCFSWIWKLVRCESVLASAWKELVTISRRADRVRHLPMASTNELILKCNVVRADTWWFIHEMRSVVAYEVVDAAWISFQSQLSSCTDLDRVIDCHEAYLESIVRGLFLAPGDDDLHAELDTIFRTVIRLSNCLPSILSELGAAIQTGEDVSEFRRSNMEALLDDIEGTYTEAYDAFMDLLEGRRDSQTRGEFFNRLSDRFRRGDE